MSFQSHPSGMPDLLTILFIGLAALGIWMLARGWRGKRVDNHPWCRKCRHDLNGLWPGAAKCPECGVDLERIDAVELGQRARRPVLAVIGFLILLCCVGWLGMGVWRSMGTINWASYKPDWWLVRDARSTDPDTAATAMAILKDRIANGAVSDAQMAQLVQQALRLQAEESATWSSNWGDIILKSWIDGKLSPDLALQFAQRAARLELEPSSALVRQWDIVTATINCYDTRTSGGELSFVFTPHQVLIGDMEIPVDLARSLSLRVGSHAGVVRSSLPLPIIAEPGEYELKSTWTVQVLPRNVGGAPATWDVQLSAPIKILPPTEDAAQLIVGPQADQQMLDCLEFQAVGLRLNPSNRGRSGTVVMVLASASEVPLSADVEFSVGSSGIGPRGGLRAQLLIGQSYRGRWDVTGIADTTTEMTVTITPQTKRSIGRSTSPWEMQEVWYGPAIQTAPIDVTWFDSIDDPNLPEDVRTWCLEPGGWSAVGPDRTPNEPN